VDRHASLAIAIDLTGISSGSVSLSDRRNDGREVLFAFPVTRPERLLAAQSG
jgi:hypothetical protein